MDLILIILFAFGGAYLGYIFVAALESRRQRKLRAIKTRQEFDQMINHILNGPIHKAARDVTPGGER